MYIMCHFLECVSLMFSLQSDRRCTQTDKLIVLSVDLLHYVGTQIYKYISQGIALVNKCVNYFYYVCEFLIYDR